MKIDYKQLDFIHPFLKQVMEYLENLYKVEFTITSLYREGDPGVHGTLPVRGVDLRCKHDNLGRLIEYDVNFRFEYDFTRPEKKVCMYHNTGSGDHIHLQVHPNTRERV